MDEYYLLEESGTMDEYYLLKESGQSAWDILNKCEYNTQVAFSNLITAFTTELKAWMDEETRLKAQAFKKILNDIIEDYLN